MIIIIKVYCNRKIIQRLAITWGIALARYKPFSHAQGKFISIYFEDQILPGTFEHILSRLIDRELNLSFFDQPYQNDETGAPAYDPGILLKVILFAYSRGITTSRKIARSCEENVIWQRDVCHRRLQAAEQYKQAVEWNKGWFKSANILKN